MNFIVGCNELAIKQVVSLTGEDGLRSRLTKSTSFSVLHEVEDLTRVSVLKWKSLGTVVDRNVFFGGGSEMTVVWFGFFKPNK